MIPETDLFATAFFLADHAAVENGKVYVNGGFWNQMRFATFPAASTFSIVGVINVPWSAQRTQHRFTVTFTDADGHAIDGEFSGQFEVNNPDAAIGEPFLMPIAATANGFVFQGPGHYSSVLKINDEEVSRWSFTVHAIDGQTPPGGSAAGGAGRPAFPDGPGSEGPPTLPGGPGSGPADIPKF